MATIAVDFDGVIHRYSRGWADGTIYDEPMPGAISGLRALMRTYSVYIHTSRSPLPVAEWLNEYGISALPDSEGKIHEYWTYRGHVLVTQRKLPSIAYIDDRGIRFETWEQTLTDLSALHGLQREGGRQHGRAREAMITPPQIGHSASSQVTGVHAFPQVRGVGRDPLITNSETAGEAFDWRRS
ncbi:hypothetical protein AB0J35_57865 [Nonomuraea angiospora]|uniref:hypothetical protein n=1 Tax=Nonomuraea angiospora TaxID=46172 RepID=UPI003440A467